jgi:hypothetical protein
MLVLWVLGLYFECLFLGSLSLCALRLSVLDVGLYGLGAWPHCSSSGEYSSFLFFGYFFFLLVLPVFSFAQLCPLFLCVHVVGCI